MPLVHSTPAAGAETYSEVNLIRGAAPTTAYGIPELPEGGVVVRDHVPSQSKIVLRTTGSRDWKRMFPALSTFKKLSLLGHASEGARDTRT